MLLNPDGPPALGAGISLASTKPLPCDEGSDFILECSKEGVLETSLTGAAWKLSGVPPTTGGDSDFTSDFTLSDFISETGLNLSLSVFTCVCGDI